MKNPLTYIKPFVTKHEPEILTGMGVSGLIFSTIWGIKATVKAVDIVTKYKNKKNIDKVTNKELFKLTWKYYWPVAASVAAAVPCIIAGNKVANRRYAALATAYTISETALQEYQDKTKEILGEKKAREIQESIDNDRIEKTYKGSNQIIMTNDGDSLFYEPISGRYFKSSWNKIQKAANELNACAIGSMTGQITVNEWFNSLGLEDINVGNQLGWDLQRDPNSIIDIEISSHITQDDKPCGAISYRRNPSDLNLSMY